MYVHYSYPSALQPQGTDYSMISTDGGAFDLSPYKEQVIATATSKQLVPSFHQIFIRGIGCNWLVCMAIMLSMQAKDINSKGKLSNI